MATMNRYEKTDRKLRAAMSVAAALCVLGLASIVWLHGSVVSSADIAVSDTRAVNFVAQDANAPAASSATGVPSAESVFRGKGYIAPEEPIAQD